MTLEALNAAIDSGAIDEIIRVAEARQIKAISRIADEITARGSVRLVLLAGGSSSGKTTTSLRLATQLRVNGYEVRTLSTDDYFVGNARNPRDENGEFDYEHFDCVDVADLTADLAALFRGEAVRHRVYDFINHVPTWRDDKLSLSPNGIIIIEGIHALNPRLTEGLDERLVYRLSIDPKPSLELFISIKPTSADARLLRRLVRDNRFRKIDPVETFHMWPKVLAGEKRWIDPFRARAEAHFDSYLEYELAALKPFVGGLLEIARHRLGDTKEVLNMLRLVNAVKAISQVKIPGDSILRETIGGSQLDY